MSRLIAYLMASPARMAAATCISALIPLLGWLSAALIALVTLRQGVRHGALTLVWGLLPSGVLWHSTGDPGNVILLVSVWFMAIALKLTVSWGVALSVAAAAAVLSGLALPVLMPEMLGTLLQIADEMLDQLSADLQQDLWDQDGRRSIVIASFAVTYVAISMLALMVARYWQAALYNPGGWHKEFYQLRLPKLYVPVWALLTLLGNHTVGLDPLLVFVVPLAPVLLAGLALIHGVVAMRRLSPVWLVVFYLALFVTGPTMLMVLLMAACIDSLVDFRARLELNQ